VLPKLVRAHLGRPEKPSLTVAGIVLLAPTRNVSPRGSGSRGGYLVAVWGYAAGGGVDCFRRCPSSSYSRRADFFDSL